MTPVDLFTRPAVPYRASRCYDSMSRSLNDTLTDYIEAPADDYLVLQVQQYAYIAWRAAEAEREDPEPGEPGRGCPCAPCSQYIWRALR